MKSRSGRPGRDAERVGDLFERPIEVVVQHHHRAVVDGEPPEAALELIAVGHRTGRVVRGRFGPDDLDLGRPTSSVTALVGTCVDEQPTQPGIESLRVTQARQVAPGVDEGLLHGILGKVGVTEDQPGDGE